MYSRSRSGATAVSSTKETALPSPRVAIERPEGGLAEVQTLAWAVASVSARVRQPGPLACRSRASALEPRRQLIGVIGVELDAQERRAVALDDRAPHRIERGVVARVAQDEVVHHLHGRGPWRRIERRRAERVEQVVELRRQQRLRLR